MGFIIVVQCSVQVLTPSDCDLFVKLKLKFTIALMTNFFFHLFVFVDCHYYHRSYKNKTYWMNPDKGEFYFRTPVDWFNINTRIQIKRSSRVVLLMSCLDSRYRFTLDELTP